jgi:hypothetical protein
MKFAYLLLILFLIMFSGGCIGDLSGNTHSVHAPGSSGATPPMSVSTPVPLPVLPDPVGPFPGYNSRSTQARYPEIVPEAAEGIQSVVVTAQFSFQTDLVILSVPVNISIYQGAHQAPKNITVKGIIPPPTMVQDYYLSFVGDPKQDDFFEALLNEFRHYRVIWNLTDDEYLELLCTYVQSLAYQPHTGGSKFPIETFVEGTGDCDDKALLLAGLLAREDYNISLLYFEAEHHVALGIASTANTFQNSGYAYIETTYPSYIGIVPDSLDGDTAQLISPQQVRIGNGWRVYQSGSETAFIDSVLEEAENTIRNRLPSLPAGRPALFQMAISGTLGDKYRERYGLDDEYADFIQQVNIYIYVMAHTYDRKGTSAWLKLLNETMGTGK